MASAAFPLVLVLLSATSGISAGLEVTAPSPVLGALGEEVSIVCKADDIPDECSFTRYRSKIINRVLPRNIDILKKEGQSRKKSVYIGSSGYSGSWQEGNSNFRE